MEHHIFAFSLIIKGTAEKVLQFIMPPKSIYNKMPWFHRTKKITFEHYREVQTVKKNMLIDIIFVIQIFLMTCSELSPVVLC